MTAGGSPRCGARLPGEVVALLGEGLSDKEIATRLSVGPNTIHSHMVRILDKLGVESRLQALIVAVRYGLVSLD